MFASEQRDPRTAIGLVSHHRRAQLGDITTLTLVIERTVVLTSILTLDRLDGLKI
jgi:hypothetical protein